MARKKDLTGAIVKGVDRLFSANDVTEEKEAIEDTTAKDAQEVIEAEKPAEDKQGVKAQEMTEQELASAIVDMQTQIEAAEARKTQGRKGLKMQRVNISLTPSQYDYARIMAGIKGESLTLFISGLVEKDKNANEETYQKARDLIKDVR